MRRWEEDRRVKRFKEKIRSAKPVVGTRLPPISMRVSGLSAHRSSEGPDLSLKVYLRRFQLQQYFKVGIKQKLEDEGFGDAVNKLLDLSDREVQALLDRLRLLPGHKEKFARMLGSIRQEQGKATERGRLALWTARSLSPSAANASPLKYHRAISIEANSPKPAISTKNTAGPDIDQVMTEEEEKRELMEELAQARVKIMLLEHQIRQKSPLLPAKTETPPILSRKSLIFDEVRKEPAKNPRKEVGVSYDSSRMRSTLVNLDIEEMCKCLASALCTELTAQAHPSSRYNASSLPDGLLERYEEAFSEAFHIASSTDEREIYNFTKNVLIRSKMEKEIAVICLVYLNRLAAKSGLRMSPLNWKRVLFTSMILASKVWDDDSYENKNFAQAFTMYTAEEINSMEGSYLALIDFDLKVSGSEYANAYFLLRTFTSTEARSFPLRALDVETVRRLQSNAQNAETCLKDIHAEALYKTL
jgi:hypothetical protein